MNIHKWAGQCHTLPHKLWKEAGSLAHLLIRTDTSGCDSCASSEGRYVLNHSSLININDSVL